MCLGFPISTTGTLQIDLNIILELVILSEYGNERDYEVDNMSPSSRRFVSLWAWPTVLVWTNVVKMLYIERWPSIVHWYAVPESTVLSCNHVYPSNWQTILHVIYLWVASLPPFHERNSERPPALLLCRIQFRGSHGKDTHRGLWKWVRRWCYARRATSSMCAISHNWQGVVEWLTDLRCGVQLNLRGWWDRPVLLAYDYIPARPFSTAWRYGRSLDFLWYRKLFSRSKFFLRLPFQLLGPGIWYLASSSGWSWKQGRARDTAAPALFCRI